MPRTPNHGYDVPPEGARDWHRPLNRNFERFDTDVEIRDVAHERESYDPKDGAKFLATDTGDVFVGDGSEWTLVSAGLSGGPAGVSTDTPRPGIPAYAEITDSGGNRITGGADATGRDGSIEVLAFDHDMRVPYDLTSGDLTGSRQHRPATIVKPADRASPLLFDALSAGETLQEVLIHWYRPDGSGGTEEYFTHTLTDVQLADVRSFGSTPQEAFTLLYGTITWTVVDGNIEYTDSWGTQ